MKSNILEISRHDFDAVIFDLDGVLTRTASVHAQSWKKLFDQFLQDRAASEGVEFEPFDAQGDYLAYVDGKPRSDGVKSFLESRGISIPEGDPSDAPEKETVWGLGNRKNRYFQEHLRREGVEVFETTVELIHNLRANGFKTGIISSSKNCADILEITDLTGLFDVRVDGLISAELGLEGKPAPDVFLEAARQLGVEPSRSAAVEDALSGVRSAKEGGFALVIGVDRAGQREDLLAHGADVVVDDLAEVTVSENGHAVHAADLRSAEDCLPDIGQTPETRLAVFLDYDGTLTPIVERPEDAVLGRDMREVLEVLARHCTVAVVSGRDLADVKERVGVPNLIYAGSHGFDISGPDGLQQENPEAGKLLPLLDRAEKELEAKLAGIGGAQVERKKFSIAVHYRRVGEEEAARVGEVVEEVLSGCEGLRKGTGKKVFELQPDVDWHKGKAVLWLLETLGLDQPGMHPIYVGDDITDEDAFQALRDRGIGIVVREGLDRETWAHCALENTDEVRHFLGRLAAELSMGGSTGGWSLVYEDYNPDQEKLREALCTLGNGCFATRGAAPESKAGETHYPGTYLAGGYNRLKTPMGGREIENEDLVNLPNWLELTFRIAGGPWFDVDAADPLSYRQELNLRRGLVIRTLRFQDQEGRITTVRQRRLVHMKFPHLAALETTVTAENWSGEIEFRSALDGNVINDGVARYRKLNQQHLEPVESGTANQEIVFLKVRTVQSDLRVAMAARTRFYKEGRLVEANGSTEKTAGYAAGRYRLQLDEKQSVRVEKIMSLHTSRDPAISEPVLAAREGVERAPDFSRLLESHLMAWRHLWEHFDLGVDLRAPAQGKRMLMILRLHIFHLLQTASLHTTDRDVGVPARGWHGEAYRGHIFWDELFIFPLLNLRLPEITRSLLIYRHRRLEAARQAAREAGFGGAMYPWQSGSDGREETQVVHLNPESGRWIPDNSHRQRHVNSAIALNIWRYFEATGDVEFLMYHGAEMFLEIARFWASIATPEPGGERYEINGVMGPDEYHEAYPGAEEGGLKNNAYTNVMAAWVLKQVPVVLESVGQDRRREIREELKLSDRELEKWDEISRKLKIVFHGDRIISQFEGYDQLKELDWEKYRSQHGEVLRLDRILEAENDSANHYKASKQADVLMLFYLFSKEELKQLFDRIGVEFDEEMIPRNIDYYLARTSHGSTLSQVVHSWVLARSDRGHSWRWFMEALESDIGDVQGGTTPEGIHLGAMAGTVDLLQRGYLGLETRGETLVLDPALPDEITRLHMKVRYRGHTLLVHVVGGRIRIRNLRSVRAPVQIECRGESRCLEGDDIVEFNGA